MLNCICGDVYDFQIVSTLCPSGNALRIVEPDYFPCEKRIYKKSKNSPSNCRKPFQVGVYMGLKLSDSGFLIDISPKDEKKEIELKDEVLINS